MATVLALLGMRCATRAQNPRGLSVLHKGAPTMQNPFTDPTAGKSGMTMEILESLTIAELESYISYLTWEQSHRVDSGSGPYKSASYYRHRSSSWIQTCREIIVSRQKQ